jgi:hypothetical protein
MFPRRFTIMAMEKLLMFGRICIIRNYKNAEHGFFYDLTRRVQKQAFADILDFILTLR